MRICIVLEFRFDRTPDGSIWTQSSFAYPFWTRYLDVFEDVVVVARVRDVASASDSWCRADGQHVTFAAIPYYIGPWQYLLRAKSVGKAVRAAIKPSHAVILRVGSQLAATVEPTLRSTGHPYGLEVVGDPYEVFAPGVIRHPLRPVLRWWFSRQLKRQCAHASAVAYVTEYALQRRYPTRAEVFSTFYSSVDLPAHAFVPHAHVYHEQLNPLRLTFMGSLEQLYKAPDTLIAAINILLKQGFRVQLSLVGDGRFRRFLEAQVQKLGIAENVVFYGQLPPDDTLRAQLDQTDIFVLPSRAEGLPRAMIEAMARGLPCIGSTVGGMPELLPPEDMVAPSDEDALAAKLLEVHQDPGRMTRMSKRNLEKAKEYHEDILRERRMAFYRFVRHATEEWHAGRKQM